MYARLDGTSLVCAPCLIVKADGSVVSNPTPERYAAAGYLPVEYANSAGDPHPWLSWSCAYSSDGKKITGTWSSSEVPYIVSKIKLCVALNAAGKLDALISFLGANPTLKFLWDATTVLDTGNAQFQNYVNAAKTALGATEEQAEAILHASARDSNE